MSFAKARDLLRLALMAPMPCLISAVLVKTGDKVAQGDAILTIEAMKLLQTLTAPCSGSISEILCQSGDTVASGALLCTINPEE
jgi:biotin carboxyl carrier protein